jgi:hypothetical protein
MTCQDPDRAPARVSISPFISSFILPVIQEFSVRSKKNLIPQDLSDQSRFLSLFSDKICYRIHAFIMHPFGYIFSMPASLWTTRGAIRLSFRARPLPLSDCFLYPLGLLTAVF